MLLNEVLEFTQKPGTLLDGTFGLGGYTEAFLQQGHIVLATDADNFAVAAGLRRFQKEIKVKKLQIQHGFADEILTQLDAKFDYLIQDLGFSSTQLDSSLRGFSYLKDSEILDLRYNLETGLLAYQKIQQLKQANDLRQILFAYSGETLSAKIANHLWQHLPKTGAITVEQFKNLVLQAIPAKFYQKRMAVLSRVWQALRIWTNDEFIHLENFLNLGAAKLNPGGHLIIVNFHSLEDKMVTKFMRKMSAPTSEDEFGNKTYQFQFLTKKAIVPSSSEIENNIRSRSASLRVLRKLAS